VSEAHIRGRGAEDAAARYLEARGLTVLARNYRTRAGELDLVAREGRCLVFVEVRARRSGAFGTPAETVGARKRARLVAAAAHYLQASAGAHPPPCRFDVLSVSGVTPDTRIEWLRDAFTAGD
jgi:putative endonuclease